MDDYTIIFEDAGTNWAAYVEELPGCVATAPTRESCASKILQAIEVHLQGLAQDQK